MMTEREIGYAQGFKQARLEMTADLHDLRNTFNLEIGALRAALARMQSDIRQWQRALEQLLPLVPSERRREAKRVLEQFVPPECRDEARDILNPDG
jgi:hypothetical protein